MALALILASGILFLVLSLVGTCGANMKNEGQGFYLKSQAYEIKFEKNDKLEARDSFAQFVYNNDGYPVYLRNHLHLRFHRAEERRSASVVWELVQHRGIHAIGSDKGADRVAEEQEDRGTRTRSSALLRATVGLGLSRVSRCFCQGCGAAETHLHCKERGS